MSFRLVSKSATLNNLERRNGRYFALFQRIRVAAGAHCVKVHGRYQSHLLTSSCNICELNLKTHMEVLGIDLTP